MSDSPVLEACVMCKRPIVPCEECDGTGAVAGEECEVCNGAKIGCPVHHDDYMKKL
ncbi:MULTISPECIES: hypothetical protein [Nocardia]|uniref:Uncharacterized protein n=1 Tax=Nocardia rhizosphaerihabitans TaxID=1691570 RepID=A0ABQ2KG17_9NOCA|nr:hypothetical protein [Nocardia rhizosphaerihabitans]GGN80541.1 hypothetical protein GCM10011610_30020 [Nocardia rhizosphaerihabitans]